MILATPYSGKAVGVLGLGKSGSAAVAALVHAGADVWVWDDTPGSQALAAVQHTGVRVAEPTSWPWEKLAAMVLSPGIPFTHPVPNQAVLMAHAANVAVVGDVEVLFQSCPLATYVGITGTNGKSTTTTLIGHILAQAGRAPQVGGNLGTAALALSPLGEGGVYVLEMSSYQLDLVRTVRFSVAVHLNLSEDHIDRHGSMEGYFAAKMHIFDRQGAGDVAVVGVDDAWGEKAVASRQSPVASKVIEVSAGKPTDGVYVMDGVLHHAPSGQQCDLRGIKSLQGAHNWQNAAAAYAVCAALGVEHAVICEAMQGFAGLAHRMQWLGEVNGVGFVNDSKATNADAAEKALKSYDKIHWILGGVAKDGGIASLMPYAPKIRQAYVIGQAAEGFAQVLEGKVPYAMCGTLEEAFVQACVQAKPGEVVMLAPACASFDQYKNFEERGEHFVRLVEGYRG